MTQTLFFYGTLRHMPLLECVLDRPSSQIAYCDAELEDHCVTWVKDQPFPMIAAKAGSRATGIAVWDLTQRDIARLRFYEGGFEYDLSTVDLKTPSGTHRAQVFFPQAGRWEAGAPWHLHDWTHAWGALNLNAAREVMGHFGSKSAGDIAHLLPFWRARGWARQMASAPAPARVRRLPEEGDVQITPLPPDPAGFFRLDSFEISHRRFDGAYSTPVPRSAFVAYDAALLLPYDPRTDRVLLIEQLRYGPLMRGDPRPWVLEPIAGLVDAGEAPEICARREAMEEAALELDELRPMMAGYASPGYSTEYFHYFLGLCDLSQVSGSLGGLAAEHEDIRSHVLSYEAALALLESGEINQTPLIVMLLWLARARDGLRAEVSNG